MDPKHSEVVVHPAQSEVVFEEYLFYAALQRNEESGIPVNSQTDILDDSKETWRSKADELPPMTPDQHERAEASRALRIASWMSVFWLLTTDIVGPFTAPYAISQVGWVPGVILFVFR